MPKQTTRISKDSPEGVLIHADFDFDTAYFQRILDEISNEPNYPSGLTVEKLMEALADQIMDEAYYTFQNHLETISQP